MKECCNTNSVYYVWLRKKQRAIGKRLGLAPLKDWKKKKDACHIRIINFGTNICGFNGGCFLLFSFYGS